MRKITEKTPFLNFLPQQIKNYKTIPLTNGIETSFEISLNGREYLGREVSIDMYDLNIDFGWILPIHALDDTSKIFLHTYKTLTINSDGSLGKDVTAVLMYKKQGLVISRGKVLVRTKRVDSLDDAFNLISDVKAGKKDFVIHNNLMPVFVIED